LQGLKLLRLRLPSYLLFYSFLLPLHARNKTPHFYRFYISFFEKKHCQPRRREAKEHNFSTEKEEPDSFFLSVFFFGTFFPQFSFFFFPFPFCYSEKQLPFTFQVFQLEVLRERRRGEARWWFFAVKTKQQRRKNHTLFFSFDRKKKNQSTMLTRAALPSRLSAAPLAPWSRAARGRPAVVVAGE